MKTDDLRERRPRQVRNVIYLNLAILAMEMINFISQQGYLRYYNLVVFLTISGSSLFLMWGVWNGKNWVRWVWIVMALIGIPIALLNLAEQDLFERVFVIYAIQFIFSLIILYYLLSKETVRWFQRLKMGPVFKVRKGDQQMENEDLEAVKFGSREEYEKWKAEKLKTAAKGRKDDPPPQGESNVASGEIWKDPLLGMEFAFVRGGWFEMDDTLENRDEKEGSVYRVHIDGFWMGKFMVTQGQWEKLMSHNPSVYKKGNDYPVEHVSWNDVQEFILELNQKTGMRSRLPTEEEWEYAARSGGRKEKWAGTDNESELREYVWYSANSGGETHPVGQKKPNGLGLYDMSGNVWEWVQRDYGVAEQGEMIRGGSWSDGPTFLTTSTRIFIAPDERVSFVGFRLVLPKKAF